MGELAVSEETERPVFIVVPEADVSCAALADDRRGLMIAERAGALNPRFDGARVAVSEVEDAVFAGVFDAEDGVLTGDAHFCGEIFCGEVGKFRRARAWDDEGDACADARNQVAGFALGAAVVCVVETPVGDGFILCDERGVVGDCWGCNYDKCGKAVKNVAHYSAAHSAALELPSSR